MVHLANTEFVEIPPELKDHVTHVGFCGNYMSVKSDAKDVAILILDQFPDGVDAAKAIVWKDFDSSPAPRVHAKVGGLSLSGSVRGHGCYVGRTIRFVEDSGEGPKRHTDVQYIASRWSTAICIGGLLWMSPPWDCRHEKTRSHCETSTLG